MIRPANEDDLAAAIRDAAGPVLIRGGGTRTIGPEVAGEVLETAGLDGIRLYEPGALTIVAGAGTPTAAVEAALTAEGQRLPFEVPDLRGLLGREGMSTIGGVVAANASGPRRVQAGACRDSLIGVRFVDGAGTIVKNGGRVMKNVTGYDLVKLMAGSRGTLGVLTEVAFKVLPAPESAATLTVAGLGAADAVAVMAAALGSPYDVSGAAHVSPVPGQGATHVRIEGFAASVAYRAGRLCELMRAWGEVAVETDRTRVEDLWRGIRDAAPLQAADGDIWRLSVKPTDAPAILDQLPGAGPRLLDWGGGLVWLAVPAGTDLRAALQAFGGHATLLRATDETRARIPTFPPETAPVAALSAALRARFDPRGILNPGMMA